VILRLPDPFRSSLLFYFTPEQESAALTKPNIEVQKCIEKKVGHMPYVPNYGQKLLPPYFSNQHRFPIKYFVL